VHAQDAALGADLAVTRSGADGAFRFEGLPASPVRVWAVSPLGAASDADAPVEIAFEVGRSASVAVPVVGAVVRGRVVSAGGRAVPGARIEARSPWGARVSAWAGEDGAFVLSGVPPGPWWIDVQDPLSGATAFVELDVVDVLSPLDVGPIAVQGSGGGGA
jgi:hypothetical protein